jgi:hypothetical protein
MHLQKVISRTMFKKNFFVCVFKVNGEKAGSGSESGSTNQRHVSADPDTHQNVIGSATLQPGDPDKTRHAMRDVLPRCGSSMNGLMASRERQRWCPMKVDIRPLAT